MLAAEQVLAGLGLGATLSVGAILAVDVMGSLVTLVAEAPAAPSASWRYLPLSRPALAAGAPFCNHLAWPDPRRTL